MPPARRNGSPRGGDLDGADHRRREERGSTSRRATPTRTPAAPTSDAVIALDMTTGAIRWVQQVTPNDAFVIGCKAGRRRRVPTKSAPISISATSPILRTLPGGRRVLSLGQKSGVVWGLAPTRTARCSGSIAPARAARSAASSGDRRADDQNVYVPVSDVLAPSEGKPADSTPCDWPPASACGTPRHRHLTCTVGAGCTGAQSAPVSVMPGVVFSGSIDGHAARLLDDGRKDHLGLQHDAAFETVNGVKAQGGSLDAAGPVIAGGMVYTNSGYGQWRGKPGNVLLAFGLP